jgi:hypothetical protein
MTARKATPEQIALAKKIEQKATDALSAVRLEARMMKWPTDMTRIVFEEISRRALRIAMGMEKP